MQYKTKGWGSGFLGVLIFSASLPATRLALRGFTPLFLTSARAVIAAGLGLGLLLTLRQRLPKREDLISLCIVAIGGVIGFPLLTAFALQQITAAQSVVFIGFLPLATAMFGVLRGGERPQPVFWVFSGFGGLAVASYAMVGNEMGSFSGDLVMAAAILLCGLGYAEGATLSRQLGGWQVISWALIVAAPAMMPIAFVTMPTSWSGIALSAWFALAYVSIFSMLVGFLFWYRGLALGGIAGVGQLQLLQPFFGLILASLLLNEPVAWTMIVVTFFVVVCVAGAKRFA